MLGASREHPNLCLSLTKLEPLTDEKKENQFNAKFQNKRGYAPNLTKLQSPRSVEQ